MPKHETNETRNTFYQIEKQTQSDDEIRPVYVIKIFGKNVTWKVSVPFSFLKKFKGSLHADFDLS